MNDIIPLWVDLGLLYTLEWLTRCFLYLTKGHIKWRQYYLLPYDLYKNITEFLYPKLDPPHADGDLVGSILASVETMASHVGYL